MAKLPRRSIEPQAHLGTTTVLEEPLPATDIPPPGPTAAEDAAPLGTGQMEFFQLLESLSDADWEKHIVYIYRQHPAISKAAEGAYIWKVNRPIDEDDVLMAHGSGRYTAALYRKAPGNKVKVRTHTFSVYNSDLPPKVLPGQVTRTPQNQDYFETWGRQAEKESATAASVPTAATAIPAAVDPGATKAVEALAEIARRSQETPAKPAIDPVMVDLWKETAKDRDSLAQRLADKQAPAASSDPLALVSKVLDFTERLKPTPPPPAADPLVLVREVLATVKETQQPARTAVDQVNELAALITAVREITETSRPAPEPEPKGPPWWAQLLTAAAPAFVPLAQVVAQRLLAPTGQPPAAAEPAAIAPAPPPPTPPPLSPEEQALKQYLDLLNGIAPSLVQAVQAGRPGGDFAADFIRSVPNGAVHHAQMRDAGAEMVTTLLQMIPELWVKLNALPQWSVFLTEFLAFDPQQQPHRPRIVRRKSPIDPDATGELPPSA